MGKTARTPSTRNYRTSSSERTTTPDDRPLTASGCPALADDRRLKTSLRQLQTSQRADVRPRTGCPAILMEVRDFQTSGVPTIELFLRTSSARGQPVQLEPPDVRCPTDVPSLAVSSCGLRPMYTFTFPLLYYDYK